MTEHTRKFLIINCLTVFFIALFFGFSVNAKAQTEYTAESFKIHNEVSMRLPADSTQEEYGLRFLATIGKDDYEGLQDSYHAVKYGFLFAPLDVLNEDKTNLAIGYTGADALEEHTDGAVHADDNFFVNKEVTPVLGNYGYENEYSFFGSIVDIKENNVSRPFSARAYYATQSEEDGEWQYTYSDVTSRAIYTVATYALNSGTEYPADAVEYMKDIVERVNAVYTDVSVTVEGGTGENGQFMLGDKLTVKGYVSRTDGEETKTLEACPAVTTAAAASGEGDQDVTTGMLSETDEPNVYTIERIGKFSLIADFGNGVTAQTDVNNQTQLTVLGAEGENETIINDSSVAEIVYYGDHAYSYNDFYDVKNTEVWKYSLVEGAAYEQWHSGFNFSDAVVKHMKAETYLYMDVLLPRTSESDNFYMSYSGDKGISYLYETSSENSGYRQQTAKGNRVARYFDSEGVELDTVRRGEWMRLAFCFRHDMTRIAGDWTFFGVVSGLSEIYFSNMILSTEPLEDVAAGAKITVADDKEIALSGDEFSVWNAQGVSSEFPEFENIHGKAAAYEFSSTATGSGDRVTIFKNAGSAPAPLRSGDKLYLRFDMYFETLDSAAALPEIALQITDRADTTSDVFQIIKTGGLGDSISAGIITGRILDETGAEVGSVAANQWYTVEIEFSRSFTVTDNDAWANFFFLRGGGAEWFAADGNHLYFADFCVSNYSEKVN